MKICRNFLFFLCFLGLSMFQGITYAQEIEDSAEVFLEEYSDDFQEYFFEALKQKGIENYDKAINLFLKCKKLKPKNTSVINELAKAYLADKKYNLAQEQAELALQIEPTNLWYLQTLLLTIKKQGKSVGYIKELIPFHTQQVKENLAHILYLEREYGSTLNVLEELKDSPFKNNLKTKVDAAIAYQTKRATAVTFSTTASNTNKSLSDDSNSLKNYKTRIKLIINQKKPQFLEKTVKEALENYPSQPYFHYALGVAYNNKSKQNDAIKSLEAALDYLIDDVRLEDKIYKELATAYNALGNTAKANIYLLKVKFKN